MEKINSQPKPIVHYFIEESGTFLCASTKSIASTKIADVTCKMCRELYAEIMESEEYATI
jgi:hypothetical protein